jgi:flagellar biosynthesis/type III secretory pathway M-ring protein FliF/YscJ
VVVSRWATAPTWVARLPEVPVEQSGKMTDKLTEAGIEFRLEKGGTRIQVRRRDLARARVTLARDGGHAQRRAAPGSSCSTSRRGG